MTLSYSFLTEPLLHCATPTGRLTLTLPGLLAQLSATTLSDLQLEHVRPHQLPAVHAFIVQLAALALRAYGAPQMDDRTEAWWSAALLRLSGGDPGAWALIAPADRPALLQAPLTGGKLPALSAAFPAPDLLDIPVTGRAWEVKPGTMRSAFPDQWLYALIIVQGFAPFGGRGLYGTFRANGGTTPRSSYSCAPLAGGWGAWVRREAALLVKEHATVAAAHGFRCQHQLLWLVPWSTTDSISYQELDPWALEVTRPIRLCLDAGRLLALRGSSTAYRVDDHDRHGVVGDPWLPLVAEDVADKSTDGRKSFALRENGYDIRALLRLHLPSSQLPLLGLVHADDPAELMIIARGFGFEQGGTMGIHAHYYPATSTYTALARTADGRTTLGARATAFIEDLQHARATIHGVSHQFIAVRLPGQDRSMSDPRAEAWTGVFERALQDAAQATLLDLLARPDGRAAWQTLLRDTVRTTVDQARAHIPGLLRRPAAAAAGLSIADHRQFSAERTPS